MAKLGQNDVCPRCREGKVYRERRRSWMRWLPASKYYKCHDCRARFLVVHSWTIKLPKAKSTESPPIN